jgi:hypothetical protein
VHEIELSADGITDHGEAHPERSGALPHPADRGLDQQPERDFALAGRQTLERQFAVHRGTNVAVNDALLRGLTLLNDGQRAAGHQG